MPRLRSALALLPLLALAGACGGSGAPDRPGLAGGYPALGATVPLGLEEFRLDFDEPVRLFLSQAALLRVDGAVQGARVVQVPGEERSLRFRPLEAQTFGPGTYELEAGPGLVLDADDHYALAAQIHRFQVSAALDLWLGSPATASVRRVDGNAFTLLGSSATPGGRAPVALLPTRVGDTTRVFVQLASGGGTGRALAWFEPGQPTMTEVALSVSPGGDLTSPAGALALGPDGLSLYVATRDALAGTVRLHRVRVSDGTETAALTLSVPPGAATGPRSLLPRGDERTLVVACASGAAGALAYVDLASFAELDRDAATPGLQPALLSEPPGACDRLADTLLTAPPDRLTADLLTMAMASDTVGLHASSAPGAPRAVRTTFDGAWVLEGVAALAGSPALLALRAGSDPSVATPLAVSDLLGAVPRGALEVRALARVPGQRALLALLDADVLARFSWSDGGFVQDDLDPGVDGVQALDLSVLAPGSTTIAAPLGAVAGPP